MWMGPQMCCPLSWRTTRTRPGASQRCAAGSRAIACCGAGGLARRWPQDGLWLVNPLVLARRAPLSGTARLCSGMLQRVRLGCQASLLQRCS